MVDEPQLPPGAYPNWKQRRYVEKKPNEALVRAIEAVVPKHESIIDLGAGCGWFVKRLRADGWLCDGVDATPDVWELSGRTVEEYDLLSDIPPAMIDRVEAGVFIPHLHRQWWDWALFSDVGEHVPREFEQKLVNNICKIPRKGFIVSWGYPHERGWNHVNCRTQVWVACEFAKRGWWADDELTQKARDASKFDKHHIRLFVARR